MATKVSAATKDTCNSTFGGELVLLKSYHPVDPWLYMNIQHDPILLINYMQNTTHLSKLCANDYTTQPFLPLQEQFLWTVLVRYNLVSSAAGTTRRVSNGTARFLVDTRRSTNQHKHSRSLRSPAGEFLHRQHLADRESLQFRQSRGLIRFVVSNQAIFSRLEHR